MRNGISISLLYFTEGNVFVMILLYHSLWLKGNNMNKENLEYLSNPNRCRADDLAQGTVNIAVCYSTFLSTSCS